MPTPVGCTLDPSEQLLVDLSRVRPAPAVSSARFDHIDLDRFVYRAGRLGNFSLIGRRLLTLNPDLPDALRDRIERSLVYYQTREHFALSDTIELAAALAVKGEPILLLKGAAYSRWIYPERGLRNFNDIDVLINPAALEAAMSVLRELGYRVVSQIEGSVDLVKRIGGRGLPTAIELHTALVHHNEYPYYRAELALDERELLNRGEDRDLNGITVRILRPVDEFLYSVLHAFYHHDLAGLRYHSDLNALLTDPGRPIDFDEAIATARRARAAHAVGLSLVVQGIAFGASAVPQELVRALAPKGLRLWALTRVLPPLQRIPVTEGRVAGHPAKVLVAPGLLGPLTLAFRWLFPGRRFLMYFYSLSADSWHRSYYLRYPAAIMHKALRRRLSAASTPSTGLR